MLRERAGIEDRKMYNTFNMGIGMVVCVSPKYAKEVIEYLNGEGEKAYEIGSVVKGEGVEFV